MRFISVFGGVIVLICNLVVSFSHTLDLFRAGGLTGGMEYVAALGVETAFLTFAVGIVVARLRQTHPGWPATIGGLLGVGLATWANIRAGWPYGVVGILLGIYFPAMLLVAEANLARVATMRRQSNQPADQSAGATNQDQPAGQQDPAADQKRPASKERLADNPATTSQGDRPAKKAAEHPTPTNQENQPADQKVADQQAPGRPATKPNNVVDMADRRTNRPATKKTASGQPVTDQKSATSQPATDQSASGRPTTGADPKVVEEGESDFKENGELPSQ